MNDQQDDEFLDQVDKKVNKTPLPCGHEPCTLGGCKNCSKHCTRTNMKDYLL